MDEQIFEPLCCHHFAGLYAGALFESVFFKKDTVFQTKKIHKIMGTVLLVSENHQSGALFVFPKFKKGTIRRRISMHEAIKHCGLFSELY